jgi:hypothetical protein
MSYTLDYIFTTDSMENLRETCNVHNFSKENEDKYLVSYNKSKTQINDNNIDTIGLHRSVIFLNNNLVCFSPPKSLSYENFFMKYPKLDENVMIEEFIEGTMINVYYNNISKNWEIATKNNIGATNIFYKDANYTFGYLFYDTCRYIGFNLEDGLNKKYCYSFVMKHPYNQMVEIVMHPSLYLIEVYEIEHLSETNIKINIKDRNEIVNHLLINWNIEIPRQVYFNNYEDIQFLNSPKLNDQSYVRKCIKMGYVIKNIKTGERTKLRNPEYEYLHKLRGNQPDFFYRYLELRQTGQVKDFLTYFPEYYNLVNMYRNTIHTFTENLYLYYINVNITKTTLLPNVPYCYKQHVYKIHGQYIKEKINEPSFKISRKYMIDYVNNLHPSVFMYALKKYIDMCYSPSFV